MLLIYIYIVFISILIILVHFFPYHFWLTLAVLHFIKLLKYFLVQFDWKIYFLELIKDPLLIVYGLIYVDYIWGEYYWSMVIFQVVHLSSLTSRRSQLAYFGVPKSQMGNNKVWKRVSLATSIPTAQILVSNSVLQWKELGTPWRNGCF